METELEEEIRIFQAGDGRRNSYASQSNGRCFDPAVVERLFTLGAPQAWQQIQALQEEFNRRFVGLYPVPATPVQTSGRGEEEHREEPAANWVNQCQVAAIRGFRLYLFLILLGIIMRW